MKINNKTKSLLCFAIGSALSFSANAIIITQESDANILADILTSPSTSGITITSSTLSQPAPVTAGTYTNISGTYGLPTPGIVLSTGNVNSYNDGSNISSGTTGSFSGGEFDDEIGDEFDGEIDGEFNGGGSATPEENALLNQITGPLAHYDVTRLTITFNVDANTDTLSFLSVFGSEEFPEFVGGNFSDGFGLFLNGENFAGVPDSSLPNSTPLTINIEHPDMQELLGTELDGILAPNGNPLLRFDIPVTPGSTENVFDIIIADSGDSLFDTTIYLAAFGGEGTSEYIPVLPSNGEPDENGSFNFDLPPVPTGTIWIDPVVSVGYAYHIDDGYFTEVSMPSLVSVNDTDGYELWVNGTLLATLADNATYTFDPLSLVTDFEIRDIDPLLELDPSNPTAFITGINYAGVQGASAGVSMTAITYDTDSINVPEPSTIALLSLALLGFRVRKYK